MKTPKNNKTKNNAKTDSFLESLRELGGNFYSALKDDLVKEGTRDIFNSLSPFTQNQELNQKGNLVTPEKTKPEANIYARRVEIIHHQEKILFTRQQKETQQQVLALQEEIKKLAESTAQLVSEVKQAETISLQPIPSAGKYHINFLTRLKEIIISIRSQIQESAFWLAAWNKKAQKRNYYWNQFKQSGSKFLLSSDRYVSTQAG